jgi:hypothetical protein
MHSVLLIVEACKPPELLCVCVYCLKVCSVCRRCKKHDSGFLVFKLLVNGLNFSFVSIVWKVCSMYERCTKQFSASQCLSL